MTAPASSRRGDLAVTAAGVGLGVSVALTAPYLRELGGPGAVTTAAGTLCAVVGAYLCLCVLVLASRLPWLEREVGHDRLLVLHRRLGPAALVLVAAHVVLSSMAWARATGQRLVPGTWGLVRTEAWMVPAAAGFVLLVGAGVLCVPVVRRRMRYETWWVTHLYLYIAVALSFGHQLTLSPVFAGGTRARTWWIALYVLTAATLLLGRLLLPLARSVRHDLRVERVVPEGPHACSIYLTGRHLPRLRAVGGQFFQWRFLTRDRWWQAHPYSLSAAPDGHRLRITVKDLGDHSGGLRNLRPGTRVVAEGPYGTFTAARRRRSHVVGLVAGIGVTPVRALLEELPEGATADVVYTMADASTAPLLSELRDLTTARGWHLHELPGPRQPGDLDPAALAARVPALLDADVYVCGPEGFRRDAEAALRMAGVPADRVHSETFAF